MTSPELDARSADVDDAQCDEVTSTIGRLSRVQDQRVTGSPSVHTLSTTLIGALSTVRRLSCGQYKTSPSE